MHACVCGLRPNLRAFVHDEPLRAGVTFPVVFILLSKPIRLIYNLFLNLCVMLAHTSIYVNVFNRILP